MDAAPEQLQALFFILIGLWMALLAAVLLRVLNHGLHLTMVALHRLLSILLMRRSQSV